MRKQKWRKGANRDTNVVTPGTLFDLLWMPGPGSVFLVSDPSPGPAPALTLSRPGPLVHWGPAGNAYVKASAKGQLDSPPVLLVPTRSAR